MARFPVVSRTFKLYTYEVKLITDNDDIRYEEISIVRPNSKEEKLRKQLEYQYNTVHDEKAAVVNFKEKSSEYITYKMDENDFIRRAVKDGEEQMHK